MNERIKRTLIENKYPTGILIMYSIFFLFLFVSFSNVEFIAGHRALSLISSGIFAIFIVPGPLIIPAAIIGLYEGYKEQHNGFVR
ncbi:hypothetical protein B1R06_14810 [Salmonella enterica]|uniref:Uncharacterized protein n=2 Tax=Salmonella enterica TaxID=28901 RepID=A0A5Y2S5X4_SALER|nr:hypothetical protein [Salmonella enterica]ECC3914967.1 hypothetical protein [Salmonella enterica subsp. diarizonae]ECF6053026.1 hypothetical protein [Salmonella enterica subsp. salamae]ECJ2313658.1 hypothetical protein [Salmonella enterica subsp. salamae]ECJ5883722.1 hypothetical protein [Salmonella enterica subsp. diarizonae]